MKKNIAQHVGKRMGPMQTQSIDTNSEIEKVQISLIRQASVAKRASIMRSLSETVITLSRRAIARANPDLSEPEVNLMFVSIHYGKDLANRVREYLINRKNE
ncbi:MAG TPA: hypothetical protein VJL89_12865 [Thermodesulfovibrionia bacterium]|nr:hypothetical protein [Thermodesulfovibrionia bacterium]